MREKPFSVHRILFFSACILYIFFQLSEYIHNVINEVQAVDTTINLFKDDMIEMVQTVNSFTNMQTQLILENGQEIKALSREIQTLKEEYAVLHAQAEEALKMNNHYIQKITYLTEINENLQKGLNQTISTFNPDNHHNRGPVLSISEGSHLIKYSDYSNLLSWIPGPKPSSRNNLMRIKLNLIYRATRDGFSPSTFYEKCGHTTPTISFIKSKEHGRVFGGYVSKRWNTVDGRSIYVEDNEAFLFSLTHGERYPVKDPKLAFFSGLGRMLWFGGKDIEIREESDIRSNQAQIKFPTRYECSKFSSNKEPGASSYLAGSEYFTVEEIEVYQVVWSYT